MHSPAARNPLIPPAAPSMARDERGRINSDFKSAIEIKFSLIAPPTLANIEKAISLIRTHFSEIDFFLFDFALMNSLVTSQGAELRNALVHTLNVNQQLEKFILSLSPSLIQKTLDTIGKEPPSSENNLLAKAIAERAHPKAINVSQFSKKFSGYEDEINKNKNDAGGFCAALTLRFFQSRIDRRQQGPQVKNHFRDHLVESKKVYELPPSEERNAKYNAFLRNLLNDGEVPYFLTCQGYHPNRTIYYDTSDINYAVAEAANFLKQTGEDHALCTNTTVDHYMGFEVSKQDSHYHVVFYGPNTGTPVTLRLTEEHISNPVEIDKTFSDKISEMMEYKRGGEHYSPMQCRIFTKKISTEVSTRNLVQLESRSETEVNHLLYLAADCGDDTLIREILLKYPTVDFISDLLYPHEDSVTEMAALLEQKHDTKFNFRSRSESTTDFDFVLPDDVNDMLYSAAEDGNSTLTRTDP